MEEISNRIPHFPSDFLDDIYEVYKKCNFFQNISNWFSKLDTLSVSIQDGKATYRHLENHIFELKVINYIHKIKPDSQITYEPQGISKNGKNCDLLVKAKETYLIELKLFHPQKKSSPIPYDHFTEGNEVIMDGHSYHRIQALRGHLIDEAYNTEEKMENYNKSNIKCNGSSGRLSITY